MENQDRLPDDEISFVDILVVLLRRRKLILWPFAVAVILAAIGYFFIPQGQARLAASHAETTYTASFIVAREAVALSRADEDVLRSMTDPTLLLEAFRGAGIDSLGGRSIGPTVPDDAAAAALAPLIQKVGSGSVKIDPSALLVVDREFQEIVGAANAAVQADSVAAVSIVVSLRLGDAAKAKAFLGNLLPIARQAANDSIEGPATSAIKAYKDFLGQKLPTAAIVSGIVDLFKESEAAGELLARKDSLVVEEGPVVARNDPIPDFRASYVRKAALATSAILFLSVVAAFIIEGFAKIGSDPEAAGRIRDALGRRGP